MIRRGMEQMRGTIGWAPTRKRLLPAPPVARRVQRKWFCFVSDRPEPGQPSESSRDCTANRPAICKSFAHFIAVHAEGGAEEGLVFAGGMDSVDWSKVQEAAQATID